MFRIGEFSKLTQVSIRMLRYYDEMGLLKPAETDKITNYRLYAAEQIPTLNRIIFLRDLGFNVAEIKVAVDDWNDEAIMRRLEQKRLAILETIQVEQDKLAKIELAKRDILQEKIAIHYNVSIKSIPSYQVLSLRRVVPDYFAEGLLWKEMAAFAHKNNIPVSKNAFAIYHDSDYREKNVDIEICMSVLQMGKDTEAFTYRNTEAVPIMACTMVYGPFENIAGAFLGFANWLQEHSQYRMEEHSRQILHRGPFDEENPDNYLTEIQIPLMRI